MGQINFFFFDIAVEDIEIYTFRMFGMGLIFYIQNSKDLIDLAVIFFFRFFCMQIKWKMTSLG